MVDRQDIDALLISALYGELTPTDEARLQTHLDSHPADRTALADLTFARNAVRESRILTVQLEPPQAVSAMLLQEAARRAPKIVTAKPDREREGWFQRFVRSFAAHPAIAAACMLVLVVGVAGTLYMRDRDDHFAGRTANEPMVAGAPSASDETLRQDNFGKNTGSSFEATLEERAKNDLGQGKDGKGGDFDDKKAESSADAIAAAAITDKPPAEPAVAKKPVARRAGETYLSVGRNEPQPKDLEEGNLEKERNEKPAKQEAVKSGTKANDDLAANRRQVGGPGAGSPRPEPAAPATPDTRQGVRSPAATVPPPPPAGIATSDRGGNDNEEQKHDQKTESDTWAREAHGRVVAAVRAKNCKDATSIAISIESRAPGYYNQNVQNDRNLKTCVTYINAERDRQEVLRAKARRNAEDTKPPSRPASGTNSQKQDVSK